jgi:hypothetical protein
VEEIAARQGCEPPKLEGVIYEPGTWFESDLYDQPDAIEAMKAKGIKVEKRYQDWSIREDMLEELTERRRRRGAAKLRAAQQYKPHPTKETGHTKADYWETWAWCNDCRPTQQQIAAMDAAYGDSYWKPKPLPPDYGQPPESHTETHAWFMARSRAKRSA